MLNLGISYVCLAHIWLYDFIRENALRTHLFEKGRVGGCAMR